MPTLAAPLDCAKLETRNERLHQLITAPSSPVTGQMYYNTGDNTFYWWDGSGWVSARGGASATPPATNSALGTVQLAGDLGGNNTAAAPAISAGAVTDTKVAAANKDGLAAVPSMRTLGLGAQQALAGNTRLDQVSPPTIAVDLNSKRLVNVADPSAGQDAATKNYVDTFAQGLDSHPSVHAATTANIATLAGGAPNTLDGVTLVLGDRILVKDQATPAQNGIYVITTLGTGANGTWVRAVDQDTWAEVPSAYVWVEMGTVNADTGWTCTSDPGGTLGTNAITWVQFSSAGAAIAGAGLTKTGNTLDVGAGAGITVNADNIQVANNGITNAMIADGAIHLDTADVTNTLTIANGGTSGSSATGARLQLGVPTWYSSAVHGAGTAITIPQTTHKCLASAAILVQVQVEATGAVIIPDILVNPSSGDVTVNFSASQSANTIRVTLCGLQSGASPTQPA